MLDLAAVVLIVLWLTGLVSGVGAASHVLLFVAIVVVLIRLVR